MNIISKNQVNFYTITEKDESQRLDNLLIKLLKGVPKSYVYRIIREKEVKVNNKRSEASYKVVIGDIIRIPPVNIAVAKKHFEVPKADFPVIYEDDYFLIINKPSGVACHGGSGINFGVIEQLRKTYASAKFLELGHRLDRDTSGILVLAKKRQALVGFQELIRNNQITKHYLALTINRWKDDIRNVKLPLFKYLTPEGERRVCVDKVNGKFAHTVFSVIRRYKDFTLVKADIKTGRTHQIRVHLQSIDYPIAGDDKYGNFEINKSLSKNFLKRMFLHACVIEFIHPVTDKKLSLKADLPLNLQEFINNLPNE